jgi:saccharopine dehydrogenase (NADP+, L-glutamate forming)
MKNILLFGAGKSATFLIDYLGHEIQKYNWEITIVDSNLELIQSKIKGIGHAHAVAINIENEVQRRPLIQNADLVISLLPPSLHFLIGRDCVKFKKNLLTASYTDEQVKKLESEIKENNLFFLYEMGLDPGIDHMSVMQLITKIRAEGGRIKSFKSHTGGLVAPQSDDNPWHYKISWNPKNVVMAGSSGAIFKENGAIKEVSYQDLFSECKQVNIDNLGKLAFYPNRNSLGYIDIYRLEDPETFIRTTLRYPEFCEGWKCIVDSGLTNDKKVLDPGGNTFRDWSSPILPFISPKNQNLFIYLGFFEDHPLPVSAKTSAEVLQYLLETKLMMQPNDKDMVVMLHEIDYDLPEGSRSLRSSLIVTGDDVRKTAMAKTVGLPLGIAAKLILLGKLDLVGLHIPILPEIYEPVLAELRTHGIYFNEVID